MIVVLNQEIHPHKPHNTTASFAQPIIPTAVDQNLERLTCTVHVPAQIIIALQFFEIFRKFAICNLKNLTKYFPSYSKYNAYIHIIYIHIHVQCICTYKGLHPVLHMHYTVHTCTYVLGQMLTERKTPNFECLALQLCEAISSRCGWSFQCEL